MSTGIARASAVAVVGLAVLAASCGGMRTTRFTNPRFDFGFVERVAVLPLDNLTDDNEAGVRVSRMLVTELLSTETVDVLEPGQVTAVLNRVAGGTLHPSTEQILELGRALSVQAVIVGSVTQSGSIRSGTTTRPVVTLDIHMVETDSGATVWAATHTERGSTLGARTFGTGTEPISETTRRAVRRIVATLVR